MLTKTITILMLILTLTSCGSFLSKEDLVILSNSSIVEIEAISKNSFNLEEFLDEGGKIRKGKGFFVSSDGEIMTNAHIIRGASSVYIFYNKKKYFAEILFIDDKKDLALLKAKINIKNFLKRSSKVDEKVFVLDEFYTLNENKLNKILPKGFSGTPVLNLKGEVVGIYTASSSNEGLITFINN